MSGALSLPDDTDDTGDTGDTGDLGGAPSDGLLSLYSTDTPPTDGTQVSPGAVDGGADSDQPGFLAKLGLALAGGSAGVDDLSAKQKQDVGSRSLMNFGLALLQGGGPSYTPRSFGQILASGLGAAEETETAGEQGAAVRQQAAAQLGQTQQQIDIQKQDAAIKLAQFKLQAALLQRQAEMSGNIAGWLKGGGSGKTPTPAGSSAAGSSDLPAPNANSDIGGWKDQPSATAVINEAKSQGVDPNLALAVAYQESGGDPNAPATNNGQNIGLFQIGAPAAATVGMKPEDIATPGGNIKAGVAYLKSLVTRYGDPSLAVLAYNAGPAVADAVVAGKGDMPTSTGQYIANVKQIVAGNPATQKLPFAHVAPPAPPTQGTNEGPGYVPSSGVRTTLVPGASGGGGGGTSAPSSPDVLDSLPPQMRALFAARLAAAVGNPEETTKVMADLTTAAMNFAGRSHFRILAPAEAQQIFKGGYAPTGIYAIDETTGEPKVIQEPTPPVPLPDTPGFQADKVSMDLAQDQLKSMSVAAGSARDARNAIAYLRAINGQVGGADALAQNYQQLIPLMQSLGIGTPEERAQMAAQQDFSGIASKLVLAMRDKGMGRLSNMDLGFLTKMAPNIGQDPATRESLLDAADMLASRQIDESTYAQRYFMKNKNLVGLDDEMEKPVNQGGLGDPIPRAPPYSAGAQKAKDFIGGLQPGQLYIRPNGQLQRYTVPPASQ